MLTIGIDRRAEVIAETLLQTELDRAAAIRDAIRHGHAVEDGTLTPGTRRYWFAPKLPENLRPALDYTRPWVDHLGNVYAMAELPYELVEAEDQSLPRFGDEDDYEDDEDLDSDR